MLANVLDPRSLFEQFSPQAVKLSCDAADCEADLLTFVRQFWHVNDRNKPLVTGWALEAICLPYEAKITTEDGEKKIGDLVTSGWRGRVLSFNHRTGIAEWKAIVALMRSAPQPLINLRLSDGKSLRVSGNHPIFVVGVGYVRADKIVPGQALAVCEDIDLRAVRRGLSNPPSSPTILQYAMFRRSEDQAGDGNVPEVRRRESVGQHPLPGLLRAGETSREDAFVHRMRQTNLSRPGTVGASVPRLRRLLQSAVLREIHHRREQPLLRRRAERRPLPAGLLAHQAVDLGTRRLSLFPLLTEAAAQPGHACASHQLQNHEQSAVEPRHPVPSVPRRAAPPFGQTERQGLAVGQSYVSAVEREVRLSGPLYNIEVESNHNYFADSVLVHNCDHLMAVTDGYIKRLIINVPPGSTKSTLASVMWPAWIWGPMRMPWSRFICASYAGHLTMRDNRKFRRIVGDALYRQMWGAEFMLEQEGQKQIINDKTGWKLATSIRGVGTGERGNVVIIDDPNNPNDVESERMREAGEIWIREVLPDRLNDLAQDAIVLIQQRTHERDATGTLLDVAGLEYTTLVIPAEYEPAMHCITVLKRDKEGKPLRIWEDPRGLDDKTGKRLAGLQVTMADTPYGPSPMRVGLIEKDPKTGEPSPILARRGELFWPARIPRSKIEEMKIIKGSYAYHGQYQQEPVPRGGGLLLKDWWRVWPEENFPPFGTLVASLDTSIKEGEENDWNAFTVWGMFLGQRGEPLLMLVDAWRVRTDLSNLVAKVAKSCRKSHGGAKVQYLLIEDKTRGHDVAGELRRLYGATDWQTILVPPHGDKVSRVIACQPTFSGAVQTNPDTGITTWLGGNVYAPATEWADVVIDECAVFPKGQHDDFVDSVTQAVLWLRKNGVALHFEEFEAAEASAAKAATDAAKRKPLYDV